MTAGFDMMHYMEFFGSTNALILLLITIWTLPWKGVALWKAARLYHKWWFIAILILNTLAILEIIYIFFVARKAEKGNRVGEEWE